MELEKIKFAISIKKISLKKCLFRIQFAITTLQNIYIRAFQGPINKNKLILFVGKGSSFTFMLLLEHLLGTASKKVVLLGGAHNKVAYPPFPPPKLWSKYPFFILGNFLFA